MINRMDSMYDAHSAVSLYYTRRNGNLTAELYSYAAAFELLDAEIDEIIRENFVVTAVGEGLSFYEKLIGPERTDLSFQSRKENIINMLNVNGNDNTLEGVIKYFRSIGFECNIREDPTGFDLYITPAEEREYSQSEIELIDKRAGLFLPSHLTFLVDFRKSTWLDYDESGKSFAEIDAMNLSWKEFERRDV